MISGLVTAISLVAFLLGTAWVFSKKRTPEFTAAAGMPLENSPAIADVTPHENTP